MLAETGIWPGSLELELTESIMMEDARRTTGLISELNKAGIKLAVDDFGTGYSSLNYLKVFLIHILKVDQSFVRNIVFSKQDQAIVKAIITLAPA
jgi:EAL domain-containing protein (putative c-di-GMP-specific phosphodiesterase class I)